MNIGEWEKELTIEPVPEPIAVPVEAEPEKVPVGA